MMWVIKNCTTGDFWSNVMGWCEDIRLAEIFTTTEVNECDLPIYGEWHRLIKGKTT